jgi:hypothetical protein
VLSANVLLNAIHPVRNILQEPHHQSKLSRWSREGKRLLISVIKELKVIQWAISIKRIVWGRAGRVGRVRHDRIRPWQCASEAKQIYYT